MSDVELDDLMRLSKDLENIIFDTEDDKIIFENKQDYWQYLFNQNKYSAEEIGEMMMKKWGEK
tara:strand:- start:146 stop:334 length:189 start_codon:yes stop_codon:yes gene_type:complete